MIDHTGIGVLDMTRSAIFYDAAHRACRVLPRCHPKVGTMASGTDINIRSFGSIGFTPTASNNIPHLFAMTRSEVMAFYEAALSAGGRDNGPPGLRSTEAGYPPGYYAAFVLGPDENN